MSRKGFVLSIARAALFAAALLAGVATETTAGQLSGRVTSSTTTNGLAGTVIRFFNFDQDDFSTTATADSLGFYTVNLEPGMYAVLTDNNQGYINEIYDNVQCSSVCDTNAITPINVGAAAINDINFILDPGGRISGTVTDASGNPLANVVVVFIGTGDDVDFTRATTDAEGNYTSRGGSATGNVFAFTQNSLGLRNEVYNNIYCQDCDPAEDGTPIAVTQGVTTTGINFALDVGAQIAGTVTSTSGSPLANVTVEIFDSNGNRAADMVTDASGNYSTPGLAGGTYFAVTTNNQGFADELYNNILCPNGACNPTSGTAIAVTIGNTTSGINFALAPGGTITGTVTRASDGAPLDDVFVGIFNSSGIFLGGANTNSSGVYSVVVPPGSYRAMVSNEPGFVNQLYNNIQCPGFCNPASGTPIAVTAGATTTNINFALQAGGSITGRVTNASTTAGVSGVSVQLFSNSGSFLQSTGTDASGNYTLSGIAAGSYFVRTSNQLGYLDKLFNDLPCTIGCTVTTGTPVNVTVNTTTAGINFALVLGGRFSGRVTNASTGAGIQNVSAQIYNSSGGFLGTRITDSSGNYTTSGLPAGTYFSRSFNNLGFVEQLYNGMQCALGGCTVTSGTPITVNAGAITPGVNFNLTLGGRISGQVLNNATGAGISGFVPVIYNSSGGVVGGTNADASGNYLTGALLPGNYFVFASPPGFASRLYNNRPCSSTCTITSGTPVAVTAGNTTGSINFRLNPLFVYTDSTLTAQETLIRTVHINELRTEVNLVRQQVGLGSFTFTDTPLSPGVSAIRAVHISELRSALDAVYDALAITRPTYTDATLTAGVLIKAAHISELRNAVEAVR